MNKKYIDLLENYKRGSELTPDEIKIANELIKKLDSEKNKSKIFGWIGACKDSLSAADKLLEIIFKLMDTS